MKHKIKALSIYKNFQCIADKCEHSCCLGWEIDIDEDTMEKYRSIEHSFGKTIIDNIEPNPEPHFRLSCNERCPFLNNRNLCDIILNLDESYLCNICNDHPRYRNYDEIGLGICCEEAARQLITETNPIVINELDIEDEVDIDFEFPYHEYRKTIMEILNSTNPLSEKIVKICNTFEFDFTFTDLELIGETLKNLERLDNEWDKYINTFVIASKRSANLTMNVLYDELSVSEQKMFSNILIYFIHRYLPQSYSYDSLLMLIRFAFISAFIIGVIYTNKERQISMLVEICRLYSSEIEYSTENIEAMLEI